MEYILKNSNGNEYHITAKAETHGSNVYLLEYPTYGTTQKFIVAVNYSPMTQSWDYAKYFDIFGDDDYFPTKDRATAAFVEKAAEII